MLRTGSYRAASAVALAVAALGAALGAAVGVSAQEAIPADKLARELVAASGASASDRAGASRFVLSSALDVAPLATSDLALAAAPASPTFDVELSLDRVMAETGALAPPPAEPEPAPFAQAPMFRLGPVMARSSVVAAFNHEPEFDCTGARCTELAAAFAVKAVENDISLSIGATASVSDRVSSLAPSGERPKFYLFVAADAQAMSFGLRRREESSPVQLDDMRLVGDAQAGVGARVGGGDLALGYITREVSHLGADRRENFVGLTFGWDG